MKKGGGSASTIIIGPSKSVLLYALHSLEYVLGLARFRVLVPKLFIIIIEISELMCSAKKSSTTTVHGMIYSYMNNLS